MSSEAKETICIICPVGCRMTVKSDKSSASGYLVSGNQCKKGEAYGIKEMTDPTRMLTTTVKINLGIYKRLPVRINGAIPKNKIFPCMKVINRVQVEAPIKIGSVIVENILDTGCDLIASRSMRGS
jgi:CxxC motif-containing protein